jgi:hypothetical protein
VGTVQLGLLFLARGIHLTTVERRVEAVSYLREAVRLATQTGDNLALGRALVNLSDALAATDPAAAAEAARTAAGHVRLVGARHILAGVTTNLAQALLMLGDWDAAEQELTQAADADGLADYDYLASYRGMLAALRGDAAAAESVLADMPDLRASEDPQDKSHISLVEAFAAAARGQPDSALRHARDTLAYADALGINAEDMRWAWPLAARAARDVGNTAAMRELLALLDACPPGHVANMLRAERDLVRACLAADDGDQAATASFAAAIDGLRQLSTPYHLAHGLLDHAQHLIRLGDTGAAELAIDEARDIADRLRCQPLLDRAAALTPAKPRARV